MSTTYAKSQTTAQKKDASSASSVFDASSQSESLQRKADLANNAAQRAEVPRPNNTGMPDNLKSGIENLSGFSMDDVRVHYNSSKPATVQALAYTQGTDIHVAPGQEKHLPHEAWHVAQQMAGRVSPTTNINGMPVNDNVALEHEADVMGEKAVGQRKRAFFCTFSTNVHSNRAIQFFTEYPRYENNKNRPGGVGKMRKLIPSDMKRHHIIPWMTINNCLADIVTRFYNIDDDIKEFVNAFLKLNAFNIFDIANRKNAVPPEDEKKLDREEREYNGLIDYINGENVDAAFRDTLASCVTWIPWNIFIGPGLRDDDPGDGFEENAGYIVGKERFGHISELNIFIQNYKGNCSKNNALVVAVKLLFLSLNYSDYIDYNRDQWDCDPDNGKYRILKTDAKIDRHP